MIENIIYLDNNSTTKLDGRVLKAMLRFLKDGYGNASSSHFFGKQVNEQIEISRKHVASLISAKNHEIIFTSGATESINLALKGMAYASSKKKHIITFKTEHKAVLDTCKYLQTLGVSVSYQAVNLDGTVNLGNLEAAINDDTIAICVMYVNNETGVINDINSIGALAKEKGVYLICDATQAVGKIPIDVKALNIDLLAFSPHKFYGPKGVGALYIDSEIITTNNFTAIQHGGGQERGFRSGTLNSASIVGFGEACLRAGQEMDINHTKIRNLKQYAERKLKQMPGYQIHGNPEKTLFNTLNFHFPDFDANVFIAANRNIAVSNGSACTASTLEASHVLNAMGISSEDSYGTLRVSLSKWNTRRDIDIILKMIKVHIGQ